MGSHPSVKYNDHYKRTAGAQLKSDLSGKAGISSPSFPHLLPISQILGLLQFPLINPSLQIQSQCFPWGWQDELPALFHMSGHIATAETYKHMSAQQASAHLGIWD